MTRKSFGLLAAVMCLALLALPISWVQAAPSGSIAVTVTITQSLSVNVNNGSWTVGSVLEGDSPDSTTIAGPGYFTATNDGNSAENLTTTVSGSVGWNAGSSAGVDTFAMNQSTDGGATWVLIDPALGASLAVGLAPGGTQSFDLQLLVPTSTTQGGVQQTITVTVTASAG